MTTALPFAPSPLAPAPARIATLRDETANTFTITLEGGAPPGGHRFAPGQFNMLYVFGVGEVPISVSGDPARPEPLVHTIRETGVVTRAIRALGVGGALGLRGPYGTAWPVDDLRGRDVLLVAGGLGLAPLRPALYHCLRHRDAYGEVALLVGARTPGDLLFRDELDAWSRRSDLQVLVTVDRADRSWSGDVGVVPPLLRRARFDASRAAALVCGPEVMMHFTVRELERLGIAGDRMYVSIERNMKCAIGLCGHCQLGPFFACKDGPVVRYDRVDPIFWVKEA
ncbi:MAG: FAD/NAD(P)-binding protein [Polyangiaceae bacterium]|nr:FAD/NAD(P)-binding protein [Polyangiaceae bacterium]